MILVEYRKMSQFIISRVFPRLRHENDKFITNFEFLCFDFLRKKVENKLQGSAKRIYVLRSKL